MLLYSLLLGMALGFSAPVWAWRMLRHGRYREGLRERLGGVRPSFTAAAEGRQTIWFHAVSVGETVAALPLIAVLERTLPEFRVVLSTTTPTGQAVARERLGADRVFFFPLDFAFAVRPWLHALNPQLLVLMESELWPRLLAECERAGVPVAVVNARVSDRSLPRYLALRRLWQPLLGKIRLLLAQSEVDRDRWLAIGAPAARTHAAGNLKYDVPLAAETPLVAQLRPFLPAGVPVMVAGSTHTGEEALLLRCRSLRCLWVLAPRHPQRTAEVAALVEAAGLRPVRVSDWRSSPMALQATDVLLVDTVGELAGLYALATVAFVGGSLVPHGGHNPLEPARFGVPVVTGPFTENFREVTARMQAAGTLQVVSEADVCTMLTHAIETPRSPAQLDRNAAFFVAQAGAVDRTVEALVALLARQP